MSTCAVRAWRTSRGGVSLFRHIGFRRTAVLLQNLANDALWLIINSKPAQRSLRETMRKAPALGCGLRPYGVFCLYFPRWRSSVAPRDGSNIIAWRLLPPAYTTAATLNMPARMWYLRLQRGALKNLRGLVTGAAGCKWR